QEVPLGVADILRKLLAKRPEDRYQTPGALAAALQPFCQNNGESGRSVASRPILPAQGFYNGARPGKPHWKKKRLLAGLAFVCLLLLLGPVGVLIYQHFRGQAPGVVQDEQPRHSDPPEQPKDREPPKNAPPGERAGKREEQAETRKPRQGQAAAAQK